METLRPLPILTTTGELPLGVDLDNLREAKFASGYDGMVIPAVAVQGSPAPILAVGCYPDWLTTFAYIPDFSDVGRLTETLRAILINNEDPRLGDETYLLSKWFGAPVKRLEDEVWDG